MFSKGKIWITLYDTLIYYILTGSSFQKQHLQNILNSMIFHNFMPYYVVQKTWARNWEQILQ